MRPAGLLGCIPGYWPAKSSTEGFYSPSALTGGSWIASCTGLSDPTVSGKEQPGRFEYPDQMPAKFVRSAAIFAVILNATATLCAQFATHVVEYIPGDGAATGYTDPASALGEPSRWTPGTFGGPVDPLNPAYLSSQLVSIGTGGSLEVRFDTPIVADPNHLFGVDFQIFTGAFFVITNTTDSNYNYIGTPATDGSVGSAPGLTRVSVSTDGQHFFTLDRSGAVAGGGLYPTDGQGNFGLPVNPTLKTGDFAGLTLDAIRARYGGSGGGIGYSLAWARDDQGNLVNLKEINFVKINVLSGRTQIDGFGAVTVPEPSVWILACSGIGALFHRKWFSNRSGGRFH